MNEYESKLNRKRTIRRGFLPVLTRSVSASETRAKRPAEGSDDAPRHIPCSPLLRLPPQRPGRGLGVFTEALVCSPPPGLRGRGAAGRGLGKSAEGLRLLSIARSVPPIQSLFPAHDLYSRNVVSWAAPPGDIIAYNNIDNSF